MAISVKFKHGSRADYERVVAAGSVDANTLYFIEDTGEIFHGSRNLARGNHYEGIRATDETDSDVITRVITDNGYLVVKDDIFVIKTPITDDKTSYTSYVYDGTNWCAMDGNYNAENVYFDDDLTFTKEIGYITLTNGSATVEAKGKNIKQLFETLFSQETDPTVTQPSVTISVPKFGAYEVGTNISIPAYTISFNPGSYEFGPDTGVTAITYTATFNGETLNTQTGNFSTVQVADDMNLKATARVDYSAGVTPLTNLGNPSETEGIAIAAGYKQATSGALTGYRQMFWGSMATADLTSTNIRALSAKKAGNGTLTRITTAEGDVCVIVAVPSSANKKITAAVMPLSMNYDAVNDFVKVAEEVTVEGANGYDAVAYDVYRYMPATITAGSQFDITIGNA